MASPELELQGAIVARLKNDSSVTALVSTRIYDPVPTGPTFPYVSFGPRDAFSDDAECITVFVITMQIDVWSRVQGPAEALRVADAVRASIHNYDFTLSTNGFVLFEHRITRTFRDPDGITTHAAMTFEGFVQRL